MVMLVRKPVKYVLEVPADHESRFEGPPSMMQADGSRVRGGRLDRSPWDLLCASDLSTYLHDTTRIDSSRVEWKRWREQTGSYGLPGRGAGYCEDAPLVRFVSAPTTHDHAGWISRH